MKKAFTLVEMIAVVIILGVVTAIAVPVVNVLIKNNKEEALLSTIRNIEEAAYNYSVRHDLGYNSQMQSLSLSELQDAGNLQVDDIVNPINNSRLEGCVLYRWNDELKQYQFTYDEECELNNLTVTFTTLDGIFNSEGWAKTDFNVGISATGENYTWCMSNHQCEPTNNVLSSEGVVRANIETDTLYVCAYTSYGNISSETICSDPYKLDKTAPMLGTIKVNGSNDIQDWYGSDITISTTDGGDALSGHLSTTVDKSTITETTSGTVVTLTTTDKAGNTNTRTYTLKVDKTIPTINISRTPSNNKNTLTASATGSISGYTYQWYKDDVAISNATNSTYETTTSGVYKVKVTTVAGNSNNSAHTIHSYNIVYNLNGGAGNIASTTKVEGIPVSITVERPTRTNYGFQGWSTSSNATTVDYTSGSTYTEDNGKTLYAVWTMGYYCPTGELIADSTRGSGSGGYICVTNSSTGSEYDSCWYNVSYYGEDSSCGAETCTYTTTEYIPDSSCGAATCTYTTTETQANASKCGYKSCSKSGGRWCYEYWYEGVGSYYSSTDQSYVPSPRLASGVETSCSRVTFGSHQGEYLCEDIAVVGCKEFASSCSISSSFNSSAYSDGLDYISCSETVQDSSCGAATCTYEVSLTGANASECGYKSCNVSTTVTEENSTECGYKSCWYEESEYGQDSSCGTYTTYYCPSGWSTYSGSGASLKCYKKATIGG